MEDHQHAGAEVRQSRNVGNDSSGSSQAGKRLYDNLVALGFLTNAEAPPKVLVHPMKINGTNYMLKFGDASGAGYGVTLWTEASTKIKVDHGVWEKEVSDSSSNVRELLNLVIKIEELAERGELHEGSELFVFTDNFVAEQAFHNGSSKSKKLYALVQRVWKLEMNHSLFVHLVWVAGTRMFGQGTDGASRGDMSNGVLTGDSMLKHVPMHLGAFERSPEQINWLSDSLPAKRQKEWSVLAPEDWFNKVWDTQLIWATPPAIAGAVVEQLCEAKQHTNPDHSHIFICPALMTASWRKQLSKLADVLVTVPVGSKVWPPEMHEPTIVIALICPLLTSSPWQVRDTKLVAEFADSVRGVWSADCSRERVTVVLVRGHQSRTQDS